MDGHRNPTYPIGSKESKESKESKDSGTGETKIATDSSYSLIMRTVTTSPDLTQSKHSAPASPDMELRDLASQQKSSYTESQILEALKAAREATATTHNIVNHKSQKLTVCALGCQGSNKDAPRQVAELLNKIISEHPELKPDLFLILGDNFYPDGVPSPVDAKFETQFHDIYGNRQLEYICGIPCIVVLGNHDGGRDTETDLKSSVPFAQKIFTMNPHRYGEAENQQSAHSYLPHPSDPEMKETKQEFFKKTDLDYKQLPKHLMPGNCHFWNVDSVKIFGLNSNTYVRDFLIYLKQLAFDQPVDPNNQAVRTMQEYREATLANMATLFAMHHPLITVGKRAYPSHWDAKHYLTPEEITIMSQILQLSPEASDFKEQLKKIFTEDLEKEKLETNANYNEMLTKIMCVFQKMSPDLVTTAHDHAIYYVNTNGKDPEKAPSSKDEKFVIPKICQVVSGGGGSTELQPELFFGMQDMLGCFQREYGVSLFTFDKRNPKSFDINIFTTPLSRDEKDKRLVGLTPHVTHLKFTSKDATPCSAPVTDERVKKIRDIVLHACKKYQEFLNLKQGKDGKFFSLIPNIASISSLFNYNTTHTLSDVDRMNELIAYLNEPTPKSFKDVVVFVQNRLDHLSNKKSDHSLYLEINEVLRVEFNGKSINDLYRDVCSLDYK